MILAALPPNGADLSVAPSQTLVENNATSATFHLPDSGLQADDFICYGEDAGAESAGFQPFERLVKEEFDWSQPGLIREFIRLEQKVLAKKATFDEQRRYDTLRGSRNAELFADRSLRDYAEVQRLKKLSEKLSEIQRYLRPITV